MCHFVFSKFLNPIKITFMKNPGCLPDPEVGFESADPRSLALLLLVGKRRSPSGTGPRLPHPPRATTGDFGRFVPWGNGSWPRPRSLVSCCRQLTARCEAPAGSPKVTLQGDAETQGGRKQDLEPEGRPARPQGHHAPCPCHLP